MPKRDAKSWHRPKDHAAIGAWLNGLDPPGRAWRLFRPFVVDPEELRSLRRARIARIVARDERLAFGSEPSLAREALELIDEAPPHRPDVKRWLDWQRDMWLAMHCELRAWKKTKSHWRAMSGDHERVARLWAFDDSVVSKAASRYGRTAAQAIAEVAEDGMTDAEIVEFFAGALRLSRRALKRCAGRAR